MTHPELKAENTEPVAPTTYEYRGETMELSALTDFNGVPVQVEDTTIPKVKTKWDESDGGKLPSKLLMITNIQPGYTKDSRYVTYQAYRDGAFRQPVGIVMPLNFKIKRLTGKQGEKMLTIFGDYKIANLVDNLGFSMTIGSIPEIFVEDGKGNTIPAFKFLGPESRPEYGRGGDYGNRKVYSKGFLAQFETYGDGTCLAWQVDSTQTGLWGVINAARKLNKHAKFSTKTVIEVPFEILKNTAEEHTTIVPKHANIYGLAGKVASPNEVPFRAANGNIHFGIGKHSAESINEMVRALDAILAVSCVSLFANFDSPIRREYHGLPGEYRLPSHGLEYRVLSNAWLFHPLIMNLVFDLGRKALTFGANGFNKHWKASTEETIDVVRFCDVSRAREIMERNKPMILRLFSSAYNGKGDMEHIYNIFKNGMESAIKDPTDIVNNWNIDGRWVGHSDGHGKNWGHSYTVIAGGEKV